ncbi:MAG TPA: flagellar hook-basal body complex protein, partial [Firmicutes bacterium]|nr:flagellar hook-basal body complex protein [Bacillota bacterium]
MRGLYLAEAAMLTQQAKLNLISHNLANQRTAGYKSDESAQTSFNEWLICSRQSMGRPAAPSFSYQPVGSMPHSVAVSEIRTDLTPGAIEETGRELDFALSSGYFTVQGQDGLIYTRNGRFFLNQEGYLVTADNLPVLGDNGAI